MTITNKVDFIATVEVKNANPNGDPLNGNEPRTDSNGHGEISDVCIKRKLRNRLQDLGEDIFVQASDRKKDDFNSLEKRFESVFSKEKNDNEVYKGSCDNWTDVRSFGQVITYQNRSIGIRGPVSISIAKSLSPIVIKTLQITRSANSMEPKGKSSRSSDTMGSKSLVEYGVYVISGSINSYLSQKTGFTDEDKEKIKEALRTLFINDVSAARPDGSMEVKELFWFEHSSKIGDVSSAKIQSLIEFDSIPFEIKQPSYKDYNFRLNTSKLNNYKDKGVKLEIIEGI